MDIFKINDIKKIVTEGGYNHICLADKDDLQIIPFNSNKIPVEKRTAEIVKRLNSMACGNGYYKVKMKNTISKKSHVDTYMILKGDKETLSEPTTTIIEEKIVSPDVCSYDEALKMQVENERLKIENAILKKDLSELNKEVEELETLLEDNQTLAEENPAQTWVQQVLEVGLPILDKHLALKQREVELKAIELNDFKSPQPMPTKTTRNEVRSVENFVMSFQNEPEFEFLKQTYEGSNSIEEFNKTLMSNAPEINQEFLKYMDPKNITNEV